MKATTTRGPDAILWEPAEPCGTGALVLGGSSGRIERDRARLLAQHGALAESIRWFGGAGQHSGPWEIPVEQFQDRVVRLRRDCDRVAIVGLSFGAECALVTGSVTPQVDTVVALAPSDVVWAGVRDGGTQTSHWTLDGVPLPFVPFDEDWQPETGPPEFRSLYDVSRQRLAEAEPDRLEEATIRVERIGTVVLVSGGDDRVWPAVDAGRRIARRRGGAGLPADATVEITHPQAGHRAVLPGETVPRGGVRMGRGGTPEADAELGRVAWSHIIKALQLHSPHDLGQ